MSEQLEALRKLTLVNTAMVGLNTLLIGVLLARAGNAPEAVMPDPIQIPTAPTPTNPMASELSGDSKLETAPAIVEGGQKGGKLGQEAPAVISSDPFENYVLSTVNQARKVSADMGKDVELPTDEVVTACVETGDLMSSPCLEVKGLLESAFEEMNMPFPALPEVAPEPVAPTMPEAPTGADGGTDGVSTAPPPTNPPGGNGGGPKTATTRGGVLEIYFQVLQERLRATAVANGDDPDALMPDDAAVAAAIASGDPRSDASAAVIAELRAHYDKYGIYFPEPPK